jgi:hypothetical protein
VTVKALLARIVVVVLCCVGLATMNPVSAEAASAIQITKVYYNSPGSDYGSNTSLNAEWGSDHQHRHHLPDPDRLDFA